MSARCVKVGTRAGGVALVVGVTVLATLQWCAHHTLAPRAPGLADHTGRRNLQPTPTLDPSPGAAGSLLATAALKQSGAAAAQVEEKAAVDLPALARVFAGRFALAGNAMPDRVAFFRVPASADGSGRRSVYEATPRVCGGLCEWKSQCEVWVADARTRQCLLGRHAHGADVVGTRPASGKVMGVDPRIAAPSVLDAASSLPKLQSRLSVDPAALAYLETLPPVPKRLHIIFQDKSIIDADDHMVQHGIRRMIDMNPGWKWTIYDDAAIDAYIRAELTLPSPMLTAADLDLVLKAHIVERSDVARLLMMWREGGFYQDVDRIYNVPMKDVLDGDKVRMVIPTLGNINFMQDLMCTPPFNPIVKRAIEMSMEVRREVPRVDGVAHKDSVLRIGVTWTQAISVELFGHARVSMPEAREAIAKVPVLKSYKEEWCDGLWIQPYPECRGVSRDPMYRKWKVKYWADEVNAIFARYCRNSGQTLRGLLKEGAAKTAAAETLRSEMLARKCRSPDVPGR